MLSQVVWFVKHYFMIFQGFFRLVLLTKTADALKGTVKKFLFVVAHTSPGYHQPDYRKKK
jgi:hypothetical protein